ncbi:MAG TPA: LytR C-terminal domain-containing protein [Ilumatobacteraceae bacterium]|nr:LytR C-terminal domain-containing protein [Ilumatobacteraceae bacterium]
MSNDPQPRNPTKSARSGSGPGSTAAIVIAAVAVVLGLLILKKLNDNSDAKAPTTTVALDSSSTSSSETPTTPVSVAPPVVKSGSKVQVANASGQSQVAGRLSTMLGSDGYTMGTAVTATTKYDTTVVLYLETDTAAKAVADTLAVTLGNVVVQPLKTPIPINTGKLDDGVGVLVMLGKDKAGKTLAEMGATAATTASTPAAAVTSSSTG